MFLSETNGRNQNIKNNFSSLRYQAGDMKDDDDSDYEDYNSYCKYKVCVNFVKNNNCKW